MTYIDDYLERIRIAKLIGRPRIVIQELQQGLDALIKRDLEDLKMK